MKSLQSIRFIMKVLFEDAYILVLRKNRAFLTRFHILPSKSRSEISNRNENRTIRQRCLWNSCSYSTREQGDEDATITKRDECRVAQIPEQPVLSCVRRRVFVAPRESEWSGVHRSLFLPVVAVGKRLRCLDPTKERTLVAPSESLSRTRTHRNGNPADRDGSRGMWNNNTSTQL